MTTEKTDHAANLTAAVLAFCQDGDGSALQESYRSVPTAARGRAQGAALKAIMADHADQVGTVLDLINNLPAAASGSRVARVSDEKAAAMRAEFVAYLSGWVDQDGFATDLTDVEKAFANSLITRATATVEKSSTGSREKKTEKLANLLADGRLTAGQKLSGPNGATATVRKDGQVTVNGTQFDNLSAAAKAVSKPGASVNGWAFWQHNGSDVGDLRTH